MKTIKGQAIKKSQRNELNERMPSIIPTTKEYFDNWHSHDVYRHSNEPYILTNSIYAFGTGTVKVKEVRSVNIAYEGRIPNVFFELTNTRFETSLNDSDCAVKIRVNDRLVGYYLVNKNALVLSDVTHDSMCANIFKSIWPELIRELGLLPLSNESSEKLIVRDITVGCDPEFEVVNLENNEIINAEEVIKGNTSTKIGVDGSGDQVEVRPDAGTPIQVTQNIRNLIKKFSVDYPNYDLTDRGDDYPLGGHIHIGVGMNYEPPSKLVELFDDFIGRPTLRLSGEARSDYRELGQVRVQPHGFEYRTCPAATFQNAAISCIIMKLAKNLTRKFIDEQEMTYRNNPTIEDYIRVGGLSKSQATYYWNFCRTSFKPAESIVAAWRIKKVPVEFYEPTLVFKDSWNPEAKALIQRMLTRGNIKFRQQFIIEYYGLKERRGTNLCTIGTWSTSRHSAVKDAWPNSTTVRIGLSFDRRNNHCTESFVMDLLRATKNFINSKINE